MAYSYLDNGYCITELPASYDGSHAKNHTNTVMHLFNYLIIVEGLKIVYIVCTCTHRIIAEILDQVHMLAYTHTHTPDLLTTAWA